MIGASVSTYLLEKSRLVVHAPGERNYHALYYLCAGPLAASLGLGAAGAHALLGPNAQADDAALFERTELALENVGFSLKERDSTWAVLAAALLLGDLTFGSAADADARVEQPETLGRIAELLGCDEAGLRFSLTKRKIRAGHEFIDTPSTSEQAGYMREGMVKAMYSKLFDWLVARVNESLALGEGKGAVGGGASGGGVGGGARFFIGILDIFGFEHFQTNSLEQLCINFTNEKLQGRFNDAIFASAAEENAVEGVAVDEADVADFENAEVLDLIERPATGILAMINEECVMPGGSDATLYDKLVSAHRSSRRFKKVLKARNQFEVVHYAGRVAYTATGMLGKNKDTVSEDMVVLMQGSELPFVRTVFADSADATALLVRKRGAKFQGVVAKFARQLDELMAVLDASDMHFIRCIKPNMDKAPGAWDADVVQRQLRCSGVLEVVRVFGMGYPDRVPHVEIVSRFACCLPNGRAPDENTPERAGCEAVLRALLAPKEFALGRSKAFLKSGVLAKLRQLREEQVARRAVYIQARARGLIQRQKWLVLWQAHLERKAAAAAEAQRRADEAECARLEAAEKARRDEEISRMNARERERALAEEAAKEAEKEAERREAERRKAEETESRREAEDALSLENGDWKKKLALSGGGGGAAAGTGAAGFALNMGKVNDAAKRASEQNEKTVNWTPRARPKDAPQQSARYQAEFKALPEDVLEYAVYLGMDPQVDQDLLWIAEEALLAPDPPGWVEMLDPKGLLYFYDENTGQSSRQVRRRRRARARSRRGAARRARARARALVFLLCVPSWRRGARRATAARASRAPPRSRAHALSRARSPLPPCRPRSLALCARSTRSTSTTRTSTSRPRCKRRRPAPAAARAAATTRRSPPTSCSGGARRSRRSSSATRAASAARWVARSRRSRRRSRWRRRARRRRSRRSLASPSRTRTCACCSSTRRGWPSRRG